MQKDTNTPSIDYTDLELAFHFASAGYTYDSAAYICRKSGKVYYISPDLDDEDDVPDNIDEDALEKALREWAEEEGLTVVNRATANKN